MIYWIVRLTMLFAILAVVYVLLAQYNRWNRRKTLEAEYDSAEIQQGSRDDFVADGMARYERSLSKKLLLGVFVVPVAVFTLLLLLANYT